MEQQHRTEQWFADRVGHVTASRMADLMARTKSGPSASRANYLAELVAERLTGESQSGYSNAAMQWGIDHEPQALAAYEERKLCVVEPVGFIKHPHIDWAGASPDGVVSAMDGQSGLVETKCPNTKTHLDYLMSQSIPQKYVYQMQWQMACTGAAWCDFASFDPRLPADLQLWIRRVDRDPDTIHTLETEVQKFLGDVSQTITKLRGMTC